MIQIPVIMKQAGLFQIEAAIILLLVIQTGTALIGILLSVPHQGCKQEAAMI